MILLLSDRANNQGATKAKKISMVSTSAFHSTNLFLWDIDQMKPLSATVVLSLFTPSFRRSTASSFLFSRHHIPTNFILTHTQPTIPSIALVKG